MAEFSLWCRNNLRPATCPLWSKSGQTRVRLDCPLCANSDRRTAANNISIRSPRRLVHTNAVVDIHVFRYAEGAISADDAKLTLIYESLYRRDFNAHSQRR
jgi:hypothetical protein